MVPAAGAVCRYIGEWTVTKLRWQLAADTEEKTALADLAAACPNAPVTYSRIG